MIKEVSRTETNTIMKEPCSFDLEQLLPIGVIRTHTKTDDTPHVTDDQLSLYRKAAYESAELYTGLLLMGTKRITEIIKQPNVFKKWKNTLRHKLNYPTSDGYIYTTGAYSSLIKVNPGSVEIHLPIQNMSLDLSPCCDPCQQGNFLPWLQITYNAGYTNKDEIPSGITLGCLKFIAWSVSNPGDVLMTVRNTQKSNNATIIGTNNVSWSSGALELWRQYARDEF